MIPPDNDLEHDLGWSAFRYALGELTEAETSAFERRLLDDQGAREALALAVELAGALAIVGREQPPALPTPSRGRSRRVAAWSSLAAAAAVLVAALGWPGRGPNPEPDAERVASAWSGLRAQPGSEAEGDDELSGPASAIEAEPTVDRPLPSWLIAGAAGPVEDSPRVED